MPSCSKKWVSITANSVALSSTDSCRNTHIYWIHTDAMITDAWQTTDARKKDARRIKMPEGRHKNEGRMKTSLEKYSPLSLLQGSKGLHVRGCWRPNVNFIFWPHCYDRHVVSFLFSWCCGPLHRGFPRTPSVGCGLPYHIWSLTLWESAGNCFGTPNSTELNNNSTPTRSPTGNRMFNRHQAEITVMQFRGYSLPVHDCNGRMGPSLFPIS